MTDDASPLPWLGRSSTTTARQSWTMDALAEQSGLQVTFENATKHDHKVSVEKIRDKLFLWELFLVVILVFSFAILITYCTFVNITSDFVDFAFYVVILIAGNCVIRLLANFMNHARLQIATAEQSRFCEWLVHSGGVYDRSSIRQFWGRRVTFFAWAQLKEPGITKYGDVFVLRNHFWHPTYLYLPRTAFRNVESAKRFHAALVLLWKTNGDLDAVNEECLEEFASSRSL